MTNETKADLIASLADLIDAVADDDPFEIEQEMHRLRAGHELLERGHLLEAAAVLYGVQGRVARAAVSLFGDEVTHDE